MTDSRQAKLNRDIASAKAAIEGYDAQLRDPALDDVVRSRAMISRAKERRNLAEYERARDELMGVGA